MADTNFNSDNEMWSEVNTLATAAKAAANLTAGEQALLTAIDAKSNWNWGDVNDFCRLIKITMLRRTGSTD